MARLRRDRAARVLPPGFAAIAFVTFVGALGFGVLAPALPAYVELLGLTNATGALLLSGYAAGRVVMSLPSGPVVDRLGMRPVAIGMSAFSIVAATLAALAWRSFVLVLVVQFCMGAAQAVFTTAGLTAVMHGSARESVGRAVAAYQGLIVATLLFAPTLGGIAFALLGPPGPFWVVVVGGVVALVLSIRVVPADVLPPTRGRGRDGLHEAGRHDRRRRLRGTLGSRAFVMSFVASFGMMWAVGGVRNTLLPIFTSGELGLDEARTGLVLTVAGVGGLSTLVPAGWALDRFGRRPVIRLGALASAVAAALIGVTTILWVVVAFAVLSEASKSVLGPTQVAVVSDITDADTRATTVGIGRLSNALGAALGPVMAGWFVDVGGVRTALFLAGGFLGLIAVAVTAMPETAALPGARALAATTE